MQHATSIKHIFQPSRFQRETPVFTGCLPSSHLISKSHVLREACLNFQFFVKIPICFASYFVFWCFNCVTAIGDAKNTLQIHVNSLFIGFAKRVLKNGKIIFLNYFKYVKILENAFSGLLGVLKSLGRHWVHYKPPVLGTLGVGTHYQALCNI